MAYPVTHFEINAQDAAATQKFYRELFGWGIDTNNPQNYGMIDTKAKGTGINGGIGASPHGHSFVTFYVETDDPAGVLAKAERLGGRRVMEPTDAGNVTYAMFADLEGNLIGLAKMAQVQRQQQARTQNGGRSQNGGTTRARASTSAKAAAAKRTTARKRTATKKTATRSRSRRSRA